MTGTGTAEVNFGSFPGANEASVIVAAPGVTAATHVEAWVMGSDSTATHTASDHRYFPALAGLTTSPGTDTFTVHARSVHKLQGAWVVHYVWAN